MKKMCAVLIAMYMVLDTFLKNEIEMDDDEYIDIEQWQTTDRSILITQTVTVEQYIELLVSCLDNLTEHSYS